MKKSAAIVLVILVLAAGAFIALSFTGPDLSEYKKTRYPRIVNMPGQKMIEVRLTGKPSEISGKAMGALFGTFFQLKKKHPDMKMAAPRARWPKDIQTKKEEWVGIFGMPVPDSVSEKEEVSSGATNAVKTVITVWEYGTVAEILHVGSYATETETIQKLLEFIKANGYTITGDHEEEYLKGPGMFDFSQNGNYTLIRYRIRK